MKDREIKSSLGEKKSVSVEADVAREFAIEKANSGKDIYQLVRESWEAYKKLRDDPSATNLVSELYEVKANTIIMSDFLLGDLVGKMREHGTPRGLAIDLRDTRGGVELRVYDADSGEETITAPIIVARQPYPPPEAAPSNNPALAGTTSPTVLDQKSDRPYNPVRSQQTHDWIALLDAIMASGHRVAIEAITKNLIAFATLIQSNQEGRREDYQVPKISETGIDTTAFAKLLNRAGDAPEGGAGPINRTRKRGRG